ncbi:transposase [Nevskia sp.]|uniref:transposase n=1 Tax=Nevskia sp. TaxID=1929292 RepID=UPI0025FEBD2C|nr:transposase [Nevskia sp.]
MPLHIAQRGNNQDACFFCDEDYGAYLTWLADGLRNTGCQLHAYVLMTNHVHLLLTPPAQVESVPRLLIMLGRRYVQYINKAYRRTGTLWDSRYKSSSIQSEAYLLSCQRYIELNPVRAGIMDDPAHYRWSSYRGHALGAGDPVSALSQPLVTPHPLYLGLGTDAESRQTAYRALFQSELDREAINNIRLALNQSQPLGDSLFLDRIEQMMGVRREARPRGRPRKLTGAVAQSQSESQAQSQRQALVTF